MSVILSKLRRLRDSIVAKNTSALLASQVISRVFQIVYVAALARYIGTEGVGKISTATALTGLVILLVAPGMTTLMIREVASNRNLATTYLGNMLFIRLVMSAPFVLLTLGIGYFAGYPRDTMYIVFIYALVYLFDALGQIFSSIFQAFEAMEYDAIAQILRDLMNVLLSLLFIFLRLPLLAIVVISLLAQICKLAIVVGITQSRVFPLHLTVSRSIIRDLVIKSLPFGALTILFSIRFQLGTFILTLFDTESAVGIYSAATTLILMLLMLAGAFSTSILPAYSRMFQHHKDSLPRFYQISYKYLMLIGFPVGLVTVFFGGRVVELIYGVGFADANASIIILSGSLFAMMGYSNGPLLNAIGKQRFFAWTQALLVLAEAVLCIILVPRWGSMGAATANTASCLGGLILHSIVCHRQLGISIPWALTLKTALATIFSGVAVHIANMYGVAWWLGLLAIAPLAYALPIWLTRVVNLDELRFLANGTPQRVDG